ncbi:MAG TPA: hypothetical protein VMU94_11565 [Streptosporangiaceae bacterium]|nr:hypothetical protein [Streptosporangiaceae bacterium]
MGFVSLDDARPEADEPHDLAINVGCGQIRVNTVLCSFVLL